MDKRPVSIYVYSALLMLNAIIGLVTWLLVALFQGDAPPADSFTESPAVTTMDLVVGFTGVAVFMASSVGLFFRQGWMRFVLIGWGVCTLLYGLLSGHITVYSVMRELVFIGILSVFLFGPTAHAWFTRDKSALPATE